MRFFQNWRFLEFLLIGASLILLPKAKDAKVPLVLMTGAWGISIVDRTQISRRLEKWTNSESERLNERIEGLSKEIPTLAGNTKIKDQVEHLKNRIEALPAAPEPLDLSNVEGAISSLNTRLSPFEELDPAQIQSDFSSLREEQEQLTQRFEELPTAEGLLVGMEQTTISVTNWAEQLVEHIQTIRPYEYYLVCDREKSREELISALQETRHHLILVNPWLTKAAMKGKVIFEIQEALNREPKVRIDIGWGNWKDTELEEQAEITRKDFCKKVKLKWKYNAIPSLEVLERRRSNPLHLKFLGTHEKYLVCDHKFAILGSHNFLTSGGSSAEREVGIRTDDPNIIKDLIDRFEEAPNLETPE